jgi:hypothetical protein
MPPRKSSDSKLDALLGEGTLNPRPQDVQDPIFVDSEFFDPRDLVQVKYEMLRSVRAGGQTVAHAARSYGVSRPTFYKAHNDFERDGLAGLLPGKRGPQGPHKLTAKVMDFIVLTINQEPGLGAVSVHTVNAGDLSTINEGNELLPGRSSGPFSS